MKSISAIRATFAGTMVLAGIGGVCFRPSVGGGGLLLAAGAQSPAVLAKQALGKNLFFDTSLSTPAGMSCGTCHDPTVGFTFPNSTVNELMGPVLGVIPTRNGFRIPPTVSYAAFLPLGPPHYDPTVTAFVGGLFWDGRTDNLFTQAQAPFLNPNEMNNLYHNVPDPGLVVASVQRGPFATAFQAIYGSNIFSNPQAAYQDIADAISSFEQSKEVNPFNSKYDQYLAGETVLSAQELDGLRLVTGSWSGRPGGRPYVKNALCSLCHGIPSDPTTGRDLWTNTCYANIGVPRNPNNPYYTLTDKAADPEGFNPLGEDFVDLGLGDFVYPSMGLPSGNMGLGSNAMGDFLQINGTFKAPTLRNVAKIPSVGFVKCYMHNGVFKSLQQVVHFYNTRNLTTYPGEVIDFTQTHPYAGLKGKPLWPAPEFMSPATLQNPNGALGSSSAQVGNLGLTPQQESDIVAFLSTLSDN